MSYPSSSSSNGVASGQSGRYTVAPQVVQSVIANHQQKSAHINKLLPGNESVQIHMDVQAATAAYFSGKISGAEFDAICNRIEDAGRAYDRRMADYAAREQAGLTKPGDLFKEFYGCTDEEAQEYFRYARNVEDIQRANEARNQYRMLHQSRHGQGR